VSTAGSDEGKKNRDMVRQEKVQPLLQIQNKEERRERSAGRRPEKENEGNNQRVGD